MSIVETLERGWSIWYTHETVGIPCFLCNKNEGNLGLEELDELFDMKVGFCRECFEKGLLWICREFAEIFYEPYDIDEEYNVIWKS
ncbi:hypothetical protein LCGC14_0978530 [marine sediment metagenome]|uniref:Uncharacterized protein n=1 Tax=marine sediment metagenome TaxID=412755 RepID=A0A0F9QSU1_9ZZZZ